ncbi:hypothetical protein PENSPDRAFT_254641 [Peniophora sp. CONT]|nr:hypothetical protein PENSPDRAFT_254641 [Peniophora sp. CONT]
MPQAPLDLSFRAPAGPVLLFSLLAAGLLLCVFFIIIGTMPRPATPVARAFRTFGCRVCNTQVTTTKHVIHYDAKGFNGPAMLVRHVSDAASADSPRKPLEMDGGWYTVRAMVCRSCGGYLGWTILLAYHQASQWMEGHAVVELSSVAYQDERDYVEAKRRRSAERQYARVEVRLEPLRRKQSFCSSSDDSTSLPSSSEGTRSRSSSLSSWRPTLRRPRRCPWQLLNDVVKSMHAS